MINKITRLRITCGGTLRRASRAGLDPGEAAANAAGAKPLGLAGGRFSEGDTASHCAAGPARTNVGTELIQPLAEMAFICFADLADRSPDAFGQLGKLAAIQPIPPLSRVRGVVDPVRTMKALPALE
jgi:hypothetical protein